MRNMIRCVVLVPFVYRGKPMREGRVCTLPLDGYREWRDRDFIARIVKKAEYRGREYLWFCDQPGVEHLGTVTEEQPYYFLGCTCTHNLQEVPEDQEEQQNVRSIHDHHPELSTLDKAEMLLEARTRTASRDRDMSTQDRLDWIDQQLQSGRKLCCGGASRLRAWRLRLQKSLATEQEAR